MSINLAFQIFVRFIFAVWQSGKNSLCCVKTSAVLEVMAIVSLRAYLGRVCDLHVDMFQVEILCKDYFNTVFNFFHLSNWRKFFAGKNFLV